MTLSCRRATRLASDAMDRQLSWRERAALRCHLLICAYCRRFQSQLQLLRRLLRRQSLTHVDDLGLDFTLHPDARARIRNALDHA